MKTRGKPIRKLFAAAAALVLGVGASPLYADLTADQTPFHSFRGLWLDRFDYSTSAQITTAMQRAQALGITDMVFQVRGEANAFYNSAYEHRELASFDPLQVAITEAHSRGIRLHAWINTMPLWRGTTLPSGSDYLINQHPEYWIRDANNDPQALNSSYVTVNPTMPEVRTHLANVVADIAKKYAIDGLHLDYIRLTTNSSGVDMVYPMDPATVARFQQAFPGQTPAANQANYKAWVAGQITLTVSNIRDALKANRPNAQLTAAVWRDADIGLSDYQQDWATWVDQGLLDAAMPMIYRKGFGLTPTPNQDTDPPTLPSSTADLYRLNVAEALERRGNSGIIIGVGEYMQDNAATAYNNTMAQLTYAKAQGANGIQLFDYGTLYNGSAAQNEVLRALTDFFNANKTAPPQTSITNFESDEGYFPTSITTSGSNQNVAASSSADRVTSEAHSGTGSQRLIINKTSGATSFLARHLSGVGTAGDFNSNLQFASIGSVGFWLKTTTPDLQVSFGADDAASGSTERGFFKNVIADGQWHKYEWFLDDVGQWDSFSGGNGRLNNIFATDSIQFIGTAASNTIYLDDVFYDAAAVAPNQWTLDANSNWSNAGNWTGGVPNGVGAVANLMRRTTAPRTITLSAQTTVGTLNMDNSASYTIAGTASLNMDVASGNAAINVVNRGSHTIAAPLVLADSTNVFVDTGATLTFSGGFATQGKTLNKSGPGEMIVSGSQVHSAGSTLNVNEGKVTLNSNAGLITQPRLAVNLQSATLSLGSTQNLVSLNLVSDSLATLLPGANKILKTNALTVSGKAKLDLNDNDAIVQATAATRMAVLADVTSWIASARNSINGRWRGNGITSTTAMNDSSGITTIGAILNDDGHGNELFTSFDGQLVDINSILLKFTYTGDADLDGDVDGDDYARIDAGFAGGLSGYANGDYDFNGTINSDDFFLIDRAFSSQGTPLSVLAGAVSAVPEPAMLGLASLSLLVLPRRRCR